MMNRTRSYLRGRTRRAGLCTRCARWTCRRNASARAGSRVDSRTRTYLAPAVENGLLHRHSDENGFVRHRRHRRARRVGTRRLVISLRDGAKLEMRFVPQFQEIYRYIYERCSPAAQAESSPMADDE